MELAKRSFRVAALFGVLATAGVITLGDALGFVGAHAQPAKLAAMEAMWVTEKAPAPFHVIAWPSQSQHRNLFALQIPFVLTPLLTHTLDQQVPGIDQIVADNAQRIRNGIPAVQALRVLSRDPQDAAALAQFDAHQKDLGYGFLLQRFAPGGDVSRATPQDVQQAAWDSIPDVFAEFWAFRLMVGFGLLMLAFFVLATLYSLRNEVQRQRWFLRLAPWMIPVPWLACEMGWITAEVGRQPWTVYGLLPTWMSASTHSVGYMVFSLGGFVTLYTVFIAVEMYLMLRFVRQGPQPAGGGSGPLHPLYGGGLATVGAMMRKED